MKKFLPLVALLTTVAFAAPSFATDSKEAPAATKEVHKVGKKAHKGKKAAGHKGKAHHQAPAHHNNGAMMMQKQAPVQVETTQTPTKVWMPSMRRGFQK